MTIPDSLKITDSQYNIVKLYVDREDQSRAARLLRGAVMDLDDNVKRIIKRPSAYEVRTEPDDASLEDLIQDFVEVAIGPNFKGDDEYTYANEPTYTNEFSVRVSPVFDGSVVSVFKYKGVIYFSTSRQLGTGNSRHPGAAHIRTLMLALLGPYIDLMFGTRDTDAWYYDFILVHPDTLNVTKALTSESLVFLNSARLSIDPTTVETTPVFDFKSEFEGIRNQQFETELDAAAQIPDLVYMTPTTPLPAVATPMGYVYPVGAPTYTTVHYINEVRNSLNQPYPTRPGYYTGFYYDIEQLDDAQLYYSGLVTGSPESVFVSIVLHNSRAGDKEYLYKIESESYVNRHKIRGDVQNLTIRILQLLQSSSLDDIDGPALTFDMDDTFMVYSVDEGIGHMRAVYDVLHHSLPPARYVELNGAYTKAQQFFVKLKNKLRGLVNVRDSNKLTFIPEQEAAAMLREVSEANAVNKRSLEKVSIEPIIEKFANIIFNSMNLHDLTNALNYFKLL